MRHSLSPSIYRAAFSALEVEATYETVCVPADRPELVAPVMAEFAARGGGNVTVPHKRVAAAAARLLRPAARRTGAVNCFWLDESGLLVADNTDVGGFRAALDELSEVDLRGSTVLLVGAGGAARAVAVACHEGGAGRIDVLSRRPERAAAMIRDLGIADRAGAIVAASPGQVYDLVVNSTPLGLDRDDPLPLALDALHVGLAFDLVYGRGGTSWTAHAAGLGIRALDGLGMLLQQARLSLENWLGRGLPHVVEVMRQALEEAGGAGIGGPHF